MERKISSVHVLFNARVLIVCGRCSSYMWISELYINVVVLLDQPLFQNYPKCLLTVEVLWWFYTTEKSVKFSLISDYHIVTNLSTLLRISSVYLIRCLTFFCRLTRKWRAIHSKTIVKFLGYLPSCDTKLSFSGDHILFLKLLTS